MPIKALELVNVNKIYTDGFHAVKNISFEVYPGDFFAVLGPNGAGKSTILGMISFLINKTSGCIKIFDYDINTQYYAARQNLGVMPQEINLSIFETPMQILLFQAGFFGIPRKKATPYAEELLDQMMLFDKRNAQVRFLSGGMKRRLMVARALIHKPKLLILDEPTAGVDIELRQSLWTLMKALNKKGLTIILTTHYLEEAERMCNHVALIHHGQVHTRSDMKSLLRSVEKENYKFDLKKPLNESPNFNFGKSRLLDPLTLEVEVGKSITLNCLFAELTKAKIEVQSVQTRINKLELLFFNTLKNKI